MFNPFVSFQEPMIDRLRELQQRYLVSQSWETEGRQGLLLSDYSDAGLAKLHWKRLGHDRYRFLFDLEDERHREAIRALAGEHSSYQIFAAFIANPDLVERRLNRLYSAAIKRYVQARTDWRVGGRDGIYAKLQLIFGELFVNLQYRRQEIRLRLTELEKY